MVLTKKHLSSRTVPKGAGGAVALTLPDAMIPAATALAQTAAAPKMRGRLLHHPHGPNPMKPGPGPRVGRRGVSGATAARRDDSRGDRARANGRGAEIARRLLLHSARRDPMEHGTRPRDGSLEPERLGRELQIERDPVAARGAQAPRDVV